MEKKLALAVAKEKVAAYHKAMFALWAGKAPEGANEAAIAAEHGYKHGWVKVGEYNFNSNDLYPDAVYYDK